MTRRQSGFTLIEVMVALLIVAGAILALANSWSGSYMRIRKASLANDVATLLERKMIETEAKYKDKMIGEIPEEASGDFGSDFPQYRWELKSRDLTLPDLTAVLVGKEGADETLITMIKQTTEFLSQAIKEVKVSIFAKVRGKEKEFSAVQYFVDYNKEFSLGGAAGAAGGAPATDTPAGATENDNGAAGGNPNDDGGGGE
jgi:general secretion pathway protein I